MDEKKQIEEMKKDIHTVLLHNCSYDFCEGVLIGFNEAGITRELYDEGYRKQSEGEWIKHPCSYECTVCKEEFFVEGYAEDYDPIADWDLHFCPNCGAKMKGGAE